MKFILMLIMGISATLNAQVYTTSYKTEIKEYTVINNDYDIFTVNGPVTYDLWKGFHVYDENGNDTNAYISPDDYQYIIYKDLDGTVVTLKSLAVGENRFGYSTNNVFMYALIENSEADLQNGKIDFYQHHYNDTSSRSYTSDGDGFKDALQNRSIIRNSYYIKDLNGLHRIDYKKHFKQFPNILGVSAFKNMKRSNDKEQFILNHLLQYNEKIVGQSNVSNSN